MASIKKHTIQGTFAIDVKGSTDGKAAAERVRKLLEYAGFDAFTIDEVKEEA